MRILPLAILSVGVVSSLSCAPEDGRIESHNPAWFIAFTARHNLHIEMDGERYLLDVDRRALTPVDWLLGNPAPRVVGDEVSFIRANRAEGRFSAFVRFRTPDKSVELPLEHGGQHLWLTQELLAVAEEGSSRVAIWEMDSNAEKNGLSLVRCISCGGRLAGMKACNSNLILLIETDLGMELQRWDPFTGDSISVVSSNWKSSELVASPVGENILLVVPDAGLVVFDCQTLKKARTVALPDFVAPSKASFAISADGRYVACGFTRLYGVDVQSGAVFLLDAFNSNSYQRLERRYRETPTFGQIMELAASTIHSVNHIEGSKFVAMSGYRAAVWDVEMRSCLSSFAFSSLHKSRADGDKSPSPRHR